MLSPDLPEYMQWLDACLSLHSSMSLEGTSGMLAPVGGGSSPTERSRAAKMVADKPVAGVAPQQGRGWQN